MTNLIYNIAGIISLVIALAGMVFIFKYVIKNGFNMASIVGIFIVICLASYLASDPKQIPALGKLIVDLCISTFSELFKSNGG